MMVPFTFTTDGSGDETLGEDYGGTLAIERDTNAYTLTIGRFSSLVAAPWSSSIAETCVVTANGAAGTVTLAFAGAIASAQVMGALYVTRN